MSVIAAKINGDKITVSSDSIITCGTMKRNNFKKLIHTWSLIAGGCGDADELTLFLQFIINHPPKEDTVDYMHKYMKNFSEHKEYYLGEEKINNEYIVAFSNKLFMIDGLFIQQVKDYAAIGEGQPYALTALHLNHTTEEAVKAACDLCCYASEPVVTYSLTKRGVEINP